MSEAKADTAPAPRWKPLDALQRRVLGVLIEKAKTTPAGYPMSINSIVVGCNQKSNRDPLMTLDDFEVGKVLDQLRGMGAVSELDWVGRVAKYKHHAYEWLGVSKAEIAVMTELLLRGAQALGDLRVRAARMEPIADLTELKPIVEGLVERGLMIEVTPAGRGQIVSHNLYLPSERPELVARHAGHEVPSSTRPPETPGRSPAARPAAGVVADAPGDEIAALRAEVAELRSEVSRLRDAVRERTGRT